MTAIETAQIVVEKDVPFGRGGGRELLCDVYRPPDGLTKRTAIVHIHGGAFRVGTKEGTRTAGPLAALGYTCVSTEYRLSQEATWPAQIQDVKACIRWTRAHADELGVESQNIVVAGYSAGGLLALVAAGSPNLPALEGDGGTPGVGTEVAACVGFYPAVPPERLPQGVSVPVLGPSYTEELYRGHNPSSYVTPRYPPTILLHGTADTMIPVDVSFDFYRVLSQANVPVELHIVEGVTHIFDAHPEFAEQSAGWIDLFLDRHVVNPRRYPSTEPANPPR